MTIRPQILGDIPAGKVGVEVRLEAENDIDIVLYDLGDPKIAPNTVRPLLHTPLTAFLCTHHTISLLNRKYKLLS